MEDVMESHVLAALVNELKKDQNMSKPAQNLVRLEAKFMEDNPLHNVKQECERVGAPQPTPLLLGE